MNTSRIIMVPAHIERPSRVGDFLRDGAALLALVGFLGTASIWASIAGGLG